MNGRLTSGFFVVALITCGVLGAFSRVTHAQLVLYDDFNSGLIDPTKWRGTETFSAPNPNREAIRQIRGGKLRLDLTSYGQPDTNTGSQAGRFGLEVLDPDSIRSLQANITVLHAVAEGCAATPTRSATARAVVDGFFFNDGSSSGPGDSTGDILARFDKRRHSQFGDQIVGLIARCTTPAGSCDQIVTSVTFTTSWVLGQADTLRLEWHGGNEQFLFTLNPGPNQEAHALSYATLGAPQPPPPPQGTDTHYKRIRLTNFPINCLGQRSKAAMSTIYDDVFVNADAAPPPPGLPSVVTILPASGALLTTEGFDLSLILEAPGRSLTGGRATLDGVDVTGALAGCIIPGTLLTGGQTFRCPGLRGRIFGPGTHILNVVLNLSDGSSVRDTVFWEVLANTEP